MYAIQQNRTLPEMWNTAGSQKAWRLLSDPGTPFKLSLAVSIIAPVETILHQLFLWQAQNTWCEGDLEKTPLVVMANMKASPAAKAMNYLIEMFMLQDERKHSNSPDDDDGGPSFLRTFMYLHQGQVCKHTSKIIYIFTICL